MAEVQYWALDYWICDRCYKKWPIHPWPQEILGNHEFTPMVRRDGTEYVRHTCLYGDPAAVSAAGAIVHDVDAFWAVSWERR
jgi:hypothetical protein